MKYKLINKVTKEEHLCDKVTIDGFDYYVSENYKDGDYVILPISLSLAKCVNGTTFIEGTQKVIATNNPNIDIPKVVDEVERLAWEHTDKKYIDVDDDSPSTELNIWNANYLGFQEGYNKSQETHPFSEEDMIEFAKYYKIITCNCKGELPHPNKNSRPNDSLEVHLQLWKEQKPKILYYE